MGPRTAAGTAFLAIVLAVLALRPVLSHPAVTAFLDGGLSRFDLLLLAVLCLPAAAIFVLRMWEYGSDSGDEQHRASESRPRPDHSRTTTADASTSFLGGQGGARNNDFEIETEPPETPLNDHLDYLQETLDEGDDLPAVDVLDDEALGESPIPDRCPGEYCDAIWTERTVLGFGGERYERVDEGAVRCLECEQLHYLSE